MLYDYVSLNYFFPINCFPHLRPPSGPIAPPLPPQGKISRTATGCLASLALMASQLHLFLDISKHVAIGAPLHCLHWSPLAKIKRTVGWELADFWNETFSEATAVASAVLS